jgi:ppGpp synthetase/RelA/SpoT-type nucleotidyltranferase
MPEKPWTVYWHQKQIDEFIREREAYDLYARALEGLLGRACRTRTADGHVTSRTKSVVSFAEKAVRKRGKYDDPVHQITDLCGARVVTFTQAESRRIGEFIEANFVIDRDNTGNAGDRLEPDRFGYRAMHYVVQMPWLGLLGGAAMRGIVERLAAQLDLNLGALIGQVGSRVADEVLLEVFEEWGRGGGDLYEALGGVMTAEGAAMLKEVFEEVLADPKAPGGPYARPLDILRKIGNRKAEVQTCTMLGHAWAAISHDRLYKSRFEPPKALKRQLHRVSALLEQSDEELARGITGLDEYMLDYGAYLTAEQIEEEIQKWETVARREPANVPLALKIAGLAIAIEDWDRAIRSLGPFRGARQAAVLRDLGLAKGRKQEGGREELAEAVRLDPTDAAAFCHLGDTHCRRSDTYAGAGARRRSCADALASYASAFKAAPTEPLALRKYLECKVCAARDAKTLTLLQPALAGAYRKSFERAAVRIHLPAALYEMGEFALLMGKPYDSLGAYAKAVYLSEDERPIREAMKSLDRLEPCFRKSKPPWAPHLDWVRRFLRLAVVAKVEQVERAAPGELARKQKQREAKEKDLKARQAELAEAEAQLLKARKATPTGTAVRNNGNRLPLLTALKAGAYAAQAALEAKNAADHAVKEAKSAVADARQAVAQAEEKLKALPGRVRAARREFLAWAAKAARGGRGGRPTFKPPVVIVVGSCDSRFEQQMQAYRDLVLGAFRGFRGTISSAGTLAGIGGIVGEVQERRGQAVETVAYLPGSKGKPLPQGARLDKRYTFHRYTGGSDFSALEPLQAWTDMVAADIRPFDVKVLGVDGGTIAALEYRVALALDACVAVLEKGGREAARLLPDEDWGRAERLMVLPREQPVVREYLRSGHIQLPAEAKGLPEQVAEDIHRAYVKQRHRQILADDKALAPYRQLPKDLREDNRLQAEHMAETLREVHCRLRRVTRRPVKVLRFRHDEIEKMAEAEHARYLVERFMRGWKWGEKKDVDKKINPSLVGWSKLPEAEKDKDRDAVQRIPHHFAKGGLEVYRAETDKGP